MVPSPATPPGLIRMEARMRRPKGAAAITAVLAVCAGALAGCASGSPGTAGSSGTAGASDVLRIGSLTAPTNLDPRLDSGPQVTYLQPVYDTLITRNSSGKLLPMLATAWSYNVANTELTLTLRSGLKFADGTAFTSAAVKANLTSFAAAGGASAIEAEQIKSVQTPDATHVVIVLKEPDPGLLFSLTDVLGMMISPAALGNAKKLATTPDGIGPYTFDASASVTGTSWVYNRNPHYFGSPGAFTQITETYYTSETAIVDALRSGQLDTAVIQSADNQTAIKADATLTTTPIDFDWQGILLLDRAGTVTPALKSPLVRQALNYAIDRSAMLAKIQGGAGQVTDQVFSPKGEAYQASLDDAYPYDPAKAKQLLAQAGYPHGFTLTMPDIPTIVSSAMAAALQSYYAAIGVKLVWATATADVTTQIEDRTYSAFVFNDGEPATDWEVIESIVLPGALNMFGSTNPTELGLIARIQQGGAGAKSALQSLNAWLVENAWFVPFYRMQYQLVTDSAVKAVPDADMAVPALWDYSPAS
jgi:peptide/nickel transport system substrate-binding protein